MREIEEPGGGSNAIAVMWGYWSWVNKLKHWAKEEGMECSATVQIRKRIISGCCSRKLVYTNRYGDKDVDTGHGEGLRPASTEFQTYGVHISKDMRYNDGSTPHA